MKKKALILSLLLCTATMFAQTPEIVPAVPDAALLGRQFSDKDAAEFAAPSKVFYPQTWFHFVDGNVDKEGITKDLEAIAGAGLSGIQFFHGGNFGGDWPGVKEHVYCLTEKWDDLVAHTSSEARRLGLRFTMQNCPGWAMSGGPWIKPENAMRHLAHSRVDVESIIPQQSARDRRKKIPAPTTSRLTMELPLPSVAGENDADYHDLMVLAFRTPLGDKDVFEQNVVDGSNARTLPPGHHVFDVAFPSAQTIRTAVFSSVQGFSHAYCTEPGVHVKIVACDTGKTVADLDMPMSSWQDDRTMTVALDEQTSASYRIEIDNQHDMSISRLSLTTAARKNDWESEAGWTLRAIARESAAPVQDSQSYIPENGVIDITSCMDAEGHLEWDAPEGDWTILRVGHVNARQKNGPAPNEAVGWECNKLSYDGADVHFANYIGRLADGPVNGKLNSMLMDSWECKTQTWTKDMEAEFQQHAGYALREYIPALFGYVIGSQDFSSRFLDDWRSTVNYLYANKFYGRMAKNAKDKGLNIAYETSSGDIFPGDPMEYYKFADVPMTEFWQWRDTTFVGSFNFKPIRPTASAARLYGKPRVDAESLTSFDLTWDEHFSRLKETVDMNSAQGVTHYVFHTYTHNPAADSLKPGTSFGSTIGTPFLRGQTWWKHMPEFTSYLARCSFMFERGQSVSDVLWYLGDEIQHKPDQYFPFPYAYKYDYCNHDILINRLSVRDGRIVTPEGLEYGILWLPENYRMLPSTLKKLLQMVKDGAVIAGKAPLSSATLSTEGDDDFLSLVSQIWGEDCAESVDGKQNQIAAVDPGFPRVNKVGKGKVICTDDIDMALHMAGIVPDAVLEDYSSTAVENGGKAVWMHRKADGADWYFVAAPRGGDFKGTIDFNCTGDVQLWDAVTGAVASVPETDLACEGGRTKVRFDLPRSGSCFIVFRHDEGAESRAAAYSKNVLCEQEIGGWKLSFPEGWGAPASVEVLELKPWKDLGLGDEASAFSGTATYTSSFKMKKVSKMIAQGSRVILSLGDVDMVAAVKVNGVAFQPVWCAPYEVDITDAVRKGSNSVEVEVTSTWFNRLVFDARQEESARKTWTIAGPSANAELRSTGLMGPVSLRVVER